MFLDKFTGGEKPPVQIINAFSTGGGTIIQASESGEVASIANSKKISVTGIVANTYKTALSISGEGKLHFARIVYPTSPAVSSTMKARITIDGKVVFDPSMTTTGGVTAANSGIVAIASSAPVYFANSLLIEVMGSDTFDLQLQTIYNLY